MDDRSIAIIQGAVAHAIEKLLELKTNEKIKRFEEELNKLIKLFKGKYASRPASLYEMKSHTPT
ncbi:MAG: hypothetical protein ACOWWR_14255 [Eubacteriales bacterium]